ncbi:hypothetical protein P4305_18925 [Bacillus thuringiensis]|nr:hypothetical protein [Bacillus thuringiensis]
MSIEEATLKEVESLYAWADRRAYEKDGKRRLSKQHTQYVIKEFKKLAERYIEGKAGFVHVENGRKATIENHTK